MVVHSDDVSTSEQIARLGSPYTDLCRWAADRDLNGAVELAYWSLGLSHRIIAIGNMVDEFHHPEAKAILTSWREDPIISLLDDLAKAIRQDPQINRQYPALPHLGNAEKTKYRYKAEGSLKEQTFLITLITHPLPAAEEPSINFWRRALRLWLVGQAAYRVFSDSCLADRNISKAARFLIADRYQEQWQLVDGILRRAQRYMTPGMLTFERFTDALFLAAEQYKQSDSSGKSSKAFLNAIIDIANGDRKPFPSRRSPTEQPALSFSLPAAPSASSWVTVDENSEDLAEVCPSTPSMVDDDEDDAIYLLPVDATDTQAQQVLTGRSFYQQQAEASHYLPWSYSKLLPPERITIDQWVRQQLLRTGPLALLGGALVWLALRFSRSLNQVLTMTIGEEAQGEWCIAPDFQFVSRLAPRRRNAWYPDQAAQPYVADYQETQSVELIPEISQALTSVSQQMATPASLADMWQSVSLGQKVDAWFNAQMRIECPRVTSGKLAEVGGQAIFDASGNHHFARMLTAHPNSVLPGACSYASWDIAAIEQGLKLPYHPSAINRLGVTNQGSLLVPLETQLNRTIDDATRQLKEAFDGNDLIRLHNQWTSYCVMALYAATGSRYLKEPFESTLFFNHDLPAVFINDKAEGNGVRNGRMVPLPDKAIAFVEGHLTYLRRLAELLASTHPVVSSQINALLDLPAKAEQPLFFLLDETLNWQSMSAIDLPGMPLFDWPLPPNLFRHRLAQQLPLRGVDNEVVDGWLGHAEKSVASYGDTSPRCWLDDWKTYRAEVNALFDRLSFDVLTPPALLPMVTRCTAQEPAQWPRKFGQRLREKNRRLATRHAIRGALNEITLYLKDREIASLTVDEVNQLGRKMLLQEKGAPYPSAALRFDVLIRLLERHESPHRHAFHRRHIPKLPENTLIHEGVSTSVTVMTQLEKWAEKIRPYADRAHCSKRQALSLGTMLLCIEKRISYTRMLRDISLGDNYRLIYHRNTYYLEYSEQLEYANYHVPVQRHVVSYHVASLLAFGQGLTTKRALEDAWKLPHEAPPLPTAFVQGFESRQPLTLNHILDHASDIVNQANLLVLPGIVAGALAGRIAATSLPMQAQVRMVQGKSLVFPDPPTVTEGGTAPTMTQALLRAEGGKHELQQQASRLFKDVKQILEGYTKPQAKSTAKSLEHLVAQRNGEVSSALMLLIVWIATVIQKGKGRAGRRFKPYEASSIHRYWGALRKLFEELAYDVDLMALSSEEVTAFYAGLTDYQETQLSDMGYFGHRLRSFHRVAAALGVEEPDWDELPIPEQGRHVRAEILSDREYGNALKQIKATQQDSDTALLLQFMLLCAYRFGLRLEEAKGLLRRDWCEAHGFCWMLLRNNQYRTLKSDASRRAIPLLFSLEAAEERILKAVLNRHDALFGGELSTPLLGEIRNGKTVLPLSTSAISAVLRNALRHVSGSPTLSLHHARHAFHNITAASLLQLNTPLATALTRRIDSEKVRQLVMGSHQDCSRRIAMGLARLMGHRHPVTGLLNYNHLVLEWADMLTPIQGKNGRILPEAMKIQELGHYKPRVSQPHKVSLFSDPTPHLLMKALRLGALRENVQRAAEALGLSPEHAATLEKVVSTAESDMRFKVRGKDKWITSSEYPLGLLRSISDTAWNRLIERAKEIDTQKLTCINTLNIEEVACQVGRNRHLLMSEERHVEVVACTVSAFRVAPSNCVVVAKNHSDAMEVMLSSRGLIARADDADTQLDMFEVMQNGRRLKYQQYAGFLLTKNESGVIRNRYEMAVAYLVTATYMYMSQASF